MGRLRRSLKWAYRPAIAFVLRLLVRAARALPRRLVLRAGEVLGAAAYHLASRERRDAISNLTVAFGNDLPRREVFRIARECFRSCGRSAAETMRLPVMARGELASLVDADSFESMERVLARGKGMVALTAHMGAWDVGNAAVAARLDAPVQVIGRRLSYGPYNDAIVKLRAAGGVDTIYQDSGARPALKALRAGRAVIVLADQDVGRLDGVFVDFFGHPAYTPTGPVALARSSGAGLVPFFITWNGLGHRLRVLPELELVHTGDKRADAVANTRRWTAAVEDMIRRHPEQWAWPHRRWRSRPPSERNGTRCAGR